MKAIFQRLRKISWKGEIVHLDLHVPHKFKLKPIKTFYILSKYSRQPRLIILQDTNDPLQSGSSASEVTGYGSNDRGSIQGRRRNFCIDHHAHSDSGVHTGYTDRSVRLVTRLHLRPRLIKRGSSPSFFHTSSRRGAESNRILKEVILW